MSGLVAAEEQGADQVIGTAMVAAKVLAVLPRVCT